MRLSNTMIHGICTTRRNTLTQFSPQQKHRRLILSLIALPCLVCTCEIHLLGPIVIEPRQKAPVNGIINTLSSIDLPRLCVATAYVSRYVNTLLEKQGENHRECQKLALTLFQLESRTVVRKVRTMRPLHLHF